MFDFSGRIRVEVEVVVQVEVLSRNENIVMLNLHPENGKRITI